VIACECSSESVVSPAETAERENQTVRDSSVLPLVARLYPCPTGRDFIRYDVPDHIIMLLPITLSEQERYAGIDASTSCFVPSVIVVPEIVAGVSDMLCPNQTLSDLSIVHCTSHCVSDDVDIVTADPVVTVEPETDTTCPYTFPVYDPIATALSVPSDLIQTHVIDPDCHTTSVPTDTTLPDTETTEYDPPRIRATLFVHMLSALILARDTLVYRLYIVPLLIIVPDIDNIQDSTRDWLLLYAITRACVSDSLDTVCSLY
jgi:hypothetical protein